QQNKKRAERAVLSTRSAQFWTLSQCHLSRNDARTGASLLGGEWLGRINGGCELLVESFHGLTELVSFRTRGQLPHGDEKTACPECTDETSVLIEAFATARLEACQPIKDAVLIFGPDPANKLVRHPAPVGTADTLDWCRRDNVLAGLFDVLTDVLA